MFDERKDASLLSGSICQLNEWIMPVNSTLFIGKKMTKEENLDSQETE